MAVCGEEKNGHRVLLKRRQMLHFFVLIVARTNAVFHDAKTNIIPTTPLDQMITEGAGFAQDSGIVQVPDLMFAVEGSLVITVLPAAVSAVAAAFQVPARRVGDKRDLTTLAVLES